MHKPYARGRLLAALIALVGWPGLLLQLYLSIRMVQAHGRTVMYGLMLYLGFFTVLTNILAALAVTLPLLAPRSAAGRLFSRQEAIGWVTASIVFVGVAYYVLLRKLWSPQGLQWLADVSMHYAVPLLFLLYSLTVLRGAALRWWVPLRWSLYPVAYFAYALVRGAVVGSYPYAFIDAATLGYAVTLRNACLLWVAFVVLAYALLLGWRFAGARQSTRQNTALR
ncbi:MAG TPA: Pr6Pr family membrane protein [Dyella sp.]|uniref:Pr6Pr family membrane protein n=1 Tax=Dyella sp. TaxID=1869338 RepID=UPI002B83621F|nr:Pr6Pr family membrane protein [Dyella sp.]HTV85135.1 Pr6Pr family membrane protein [Dyella sp.]